MKRPRIKPPNRIINNELLLVSFSPIRLPIGAIPISTPIKNIVKPKIINKAPNRKFFNKEVSIGDTVKCKINTKTISGIIEKIMSFSL